MKLTLNFQKMLAKINEMERIEKRIANKTNTYTKHYKKWFFRVATAQGKQGIWLLTFPDRENTGNLVNLFFYTGKIVATQGKF